MGWFSLQGQVCAWIRGRHDKTDLLISRRKLCQGRMIDEKQASLDFSLWWDVGSLVGALILKVGSTSVDFWNLKFQRGL